MEPAALNLILARADEDGVEFALMVADADASTRQALDERNISIGRCCNHGGKNLGNAARETGKSKSCRCPTKQKANGGGPYKDGTKEHKKISGEMASSMQAAFGAITMEVCRTEDGETFDVTAARKEWTARIKHIVHHYLGDHIVFEVSTVDGDWELWDVVSKCEKHQCVVHEEGYSGQIGTTGGLVEYSGDVFDCPDQKEAMFKYMEEHLLCDVDQFITDVGGVRTNLVETVWKSFLKFRTKDKNLGGDRYCMVSNVAGASFNQPLIMQNTKYSDYCYQARFCELVHIPVAAHVRRKWDDMNQDRMKQSIKRRTEAYRIKHALGKQKRRKKKQEDKATYDAEQKAAKKAASSIDKQPV